MNNLIKKYAMNITEDDIKNFCKKENVNITDDEVSAINRIIKTDIDNILSSNDPLKYIERYKPLFSDQAFNIIEAYYNKYRKFIN